MKQLSNLYTSHCLSHTMYTSFIQWLHCHC